MSSLKRMGVSYGKLGLATPASVIEARSAGVEASAAALVTEGIPELVSYIFDLKRGSGNADFLIPFGEIDPAFDVRPDDREALLLAAAVAGLEMENETHVSGELALCILTVSMGGARRPAFDDQLLQLAERTLAASQGEQKTAPARRTYLPQPKALTSVIVSVEEAPSNSQIGVVKSGLVNGLKELGKYAEQNALASAKNDNILLDYIKGLEEELRTYWWVTGGWNVEVGKPYRNLPLLQAALHAGKELSGRNSNSLGIFAAPALLSLVVESGRKSKIPVIDLVAAATAHGIAFRKEHYVSIASGAYAALLPVCTAQGYAAESEDAEDWQPRFKRLTGIDCTTTIPLIDLAMQVYREHLVLRLLSA